MNLPQNAPRPPVSLFALLNLNKPPGMTSRDAISRVQRVLPRRTKIGHAGTLDPLARGVLVTCLGPATRLVPYIHAMPKSYTGTFLLGRTSPTEDTDGPVTELTDPRVPTREELIAAAARFVGRIQQRPPDYSAVKLSGRCAYDLARRGERVDLAERPVDVYRLEVVAYDYPELTLDVRCGSGTYVRSLGRDLARAVGTEAVMSALVRTAVGNFSLDEAVAPAQLNAATVAAHLLPPVRAVTGLPRITLTADELTEIRHGRTIAARPLSGICPPIGAVGLPGDVEVAAVDEQDRLVAILVERRGGRLGPTRTFFVEG